MLLRKNLGESYSPLYFLASLGNGGMTVAMFIYLNFMIAHPNTGMVTFNDLQPRLLGDNPITAGAILLAMVSMLYFSYRHFWLLAWNLREYSRFRRTAAYTRLVQGNGNVTLMAIPLNLGMAVNVLFVMGAIFVPNLWGVVEYLFPVALVLYGLIGALALTIFGRYFARSLATGSFDCARNNNLSQMIAIMTFVMVGVGFSASAAMSEQLITVAVGAFGAIFFTSAAILLGLASFVLGLRAMLEHGVDQEASTSLWSIIPILTLLGITLIRLSHGMHHHFAYDSTPAFYFVLTSSFFALQLLFGGLGYMVMKQVRYAETFIDGEKRSAGSYSLICPGVALFVFGMFLIHFGLVQTGLLVKFSWPYYGLIALLAMVQIKTVLTMWKLDHKLLRPDRSAPATGGEIANPV